MRNTIPTIYYRLPDYTFHDAPFSAEHPSPRDEMHIKRERIESQLEALLGGSSTSKSGSILLTGYRGVGKTSLIQKVIRRLKWLHEDAVKHQRSILFATATPLVARINALRWLWDRKDFRWEPNENAKDRGTPHHPPRMIKFSILNLAQDDIDDRAILRLLAIELRNQIVDLPYRIPVFVNRDFLKRFLRRTLVLILLLTAIAASFIFIHNLTNQPIWADWWQIVNDEPKDGHYVPRWAQIAVRVIMPFTFAVIILFLARRTFQAKYPTRRRLIKDLDHLIIRFNSQVTSESQHGLAALVNLNPFTWAKRRQVMQAPATTKEVELKLIEVLERLALLREDLQVIFIIDELDKLIPQSNPGISEKDSQDPTDEFLRASTQGLKGFENDQVRKRQEAIGALFANLKHFLNVAKAKFVFIGGRELYDATLADTSKRDAFFGSIFSQVLHLPSFLKNPFSYEDGDHFNGLSSTVERFIKQNVTGEMQGGDISFKELASRGLYAGAPEGSPPSREHVSSALLNFCIYLTFRSNGIPKRLVQLFERRVVLLDKAVIGSLTRHGDLNWLCDMRADKPSALQPGLYLRLDAEQQYAHTLLCQIYRPFLSLSSRHYGALSDKHLVALTYIIDHILKFHPTSFSFFNLEMSPEAIAVNKVPGLRKFMTDVLNKLEVQHIRKVDNGMFGYQFYSKMYNELAHLSKVSEMDEAAINFTLDESLPVKQHFYKRLYHLIALKKKESHNYGVRSMATIPGLHETLGDLHFLDTEYEEALSQFREATHYCAPPVDVHTNAILGLPGHVVPEQFNEYIKLILKQVHCLAKMKAREDALTLGSSLNCTMIQYLNALSAKQDAPLAVPANANWRLMLLAMMVKPALVEKVSRNGLRRADLKELELFQSTIGKLLKAEHSRQRLLGAAYVQLGTILHYGGTRLEPADSEELVNFPYCSALEFYWAALCQLSGKDAAEALDWTRVKPACMRSMPRASLLANALSKYFDAAICPEGSHMDSSSQSPDSDHNKNGIHELRRGEPGDHSSRPPSLRGEGGTQKWSFQAPLEHTPEALLGSLETWVDGTEDAQYANATKLLIQASAAYTLAGQSYAAVFQLKKLFFFLQEQPWGPIQPEGSLVQFMHHVHAVALSMTHGYNMHADRQQLAKVGLATSAPEDEVHVAYHSELLEVDLLYYELQLSVNGKLNDRLDESFLQRQLGTRNCLQYTRGRLLMFIIRWNWKRLLPGNSPNIKSVLAHIPNLDAAEQQAWADLSRDAIYCCQQLIGIAHLFGSSYMSNHTVLAKTHDNMGKWCEVLLALPETVRDRAITELQQLMEKRINTRLDPLMHYSAAKHHYGLAESMHNRGQAFYRAMEDMYFIEDDYNDNLYHFSCALERLRLENIRNGSQLSDMNTRINELQDELAAT